MLVRTIDQEWFQVKSYDGLVMMQTKQIIEEVEEELNQDQIRDWDSILKCRKAIKLIEQLIPRFNVARDV